MYRLYLLILIHLTAPLYSAFTGPCDAALTPLHQAAIDNNTQIITDLITQGADIHAETRNGMTPLHLAIWHNHYAATNTLLQKGANALVQTSKRNATPWHFACRLLYKYDAFMACIENDTDKKTSANTQESLYAAQTKIMNERKELLETNNQSIKTQKALETYDKKLIAIREALLNKSSSYNPLAIVCTPHVDCRTKSPEKIAQHVEETKRKIYLLVSRGALLDRRTAEQLIISFGSSPYGPNLLEVDLLPFVLACHPLTKSCKKLPDRVDTVDLTAFTPAQKMVLQERTKALLKEVQDIEASLKK